jgi:hypothetical protein
MKRYILFAFLAFIFVFFQKINAQKVLNFDAELSKNSVDFQFPDAKDSSVKAVSELIGTHQFIEDLESNLSKSLKLTHFLHNIWKKTAGEPFSNWHEPVTIAQKLKAGKAVDQKSLAAVLAACLIAEHVPARLVFLHNLKGKTDQNYVVVEAWIRENQTWAVLDPSLDFVPSEYGRPLPATELQSNFAEKRFLANFIEGSKTDVKKFTKCLKSSLQSFSVPLNFQFGNPNFGEVFLILLPRETDDLPQFFVDIYGKKTISTHSTADFYKKPY